jgi:hypothetical protein
MINLRSIPLVTRAEEDAQLRTPRAGERLCVNNKTCLGNEKFGHILKEFHAQPENLMADRTGRRDTKALMCLLCIRDFCARQYAQLAHSKQEVPATYTFQTHGVLVNKEGEYVIEDVLRPTAEMPYPMVLNKPNAYDPIPFEGGIMLKQVGYTVCTKEMCAQRDFRPGVSRGSKNFGATE